MSDYQSKYENFIAAYRRLAEGVEIYTQDPSNTIVRDGLIQRFEFTFELAWKTIKAVYEEEGLSTTSSPKPILREAYAEGLIHDEQLWLDMLEDRNAVSHIYKEEIAADVCADIKERYLDAIQRLIEALQPRINKQ